MPPSPRRGTAAVLGVALLAVLAFAGPPAGARDGVTGSGWVRQIGTYDYLLTPDYDGLAPITDVPARVTLGLGTFDRLDGELVLLGGVIYRVGIDGRPGVVDEPRTTPFFQAVRFSPQRHSSVPPGTTCTELLALVDDLAGTSDGLLAVRVRGSFEAVTFRSVPPQEPPYLPISDVIAADQVQFPLSDVTATLVGFRGGRDVLGIGAPGLHLHGVTNDRAVGGHVLSCTAGADVRLSLQVTRGAMVEASG